MGTTAIPTVQPAEVARLKVPFVHWSVDGLGTPEEKKAVLRSSGPIPVRCGLA
jgi:hypothetical protein